MIKFNTASVDSFVISFSNEISLEVSQMIKFYFQEINKIEYIIDVIPSYTTILILSLIHI